MHICALGAYQHLIDFPIRHCFNCRFWWRILARFGPDPGNHRLGSFLSASSCQSGCSRSAAGLPVKRRSVRQLLTSFGITLSDRRQTIVEQEPFGQSNACLERAFCLDTASGGIVFLRYQPSDMRQTSTTSSGEYCLLRTVCSNTARERS